MFNDELVRSRLRARRLVRHASNLVLIGVFFSVVVAGVVGEYTPTDVARPAVAVAATTVVVRLMVDWRLSRSVRGHRQRDFEKWAGARGLQPDPEPVENRRRFALLRRSGLQVQRAVTQPVEGGRLTLMEWSYAGVEGSRVFLSGLVIHTEPTGSQLMLYKAGRFRRFRLPGMLPRRASGQPLLDEAFVIEGEDEATWIDAAVAEALLPFAERGATIEVRDDVVVVQCSRVSAEQWEPLFMEGERLTAALVSRAVSE